MISKIRGKITDNFKNLSMEELINKIKEANQDIRNNILDLKYDIIQQNKKVEREHRIIFFV